MNDYVIMPAEDYRAICTAVREKTGETDLLKSGDIPIQIQGIETGMSAEEVDKMVSDAVEAHNAIILADCNAVLPTKGVEPAETLEQVPDRIEEIETGGGAEEEILLTDNGVMYKRNMVIEGMPRYGLGSNAYMHAHEMETFRAADIDMGNGLSSSALRFCEKLKTAYLPKIRRIGNTFFGDDTALEEVTLGCAEVPMVQIQPNAFQYCSALVRLNLIGNISNSMNFQYSPLSVESMKMVIASLTNLTGTGNEHAYSLTFSEACWTALEADSTAPDGNTWKEYVFSTLCWTT